MESQCRADHGKRRESGEAEGNLPPQSGRDRSVGGSWLINALIAVAARAEALHSTLAQEKELLAKRLKERDHRLQCDEVAGRITAKGKSRQQLDE
jgi:hypothetical protein